MDGNRPKILPTNLLLCKNVVSMLPDRVTILFNANVNLNFVFVVLFCVEFPRTRCEDNALYSIWYR